MFTQHSDSTRGCCKKLQNSRRLESAEAWRSSVVLARGVWVTKVQSARERSAICWRVLASEHNCIREQWRGFSNIFSKGSPGLPATARTKRHRKSSKLCRPFRLRGTSWSNGNTVNLQSHCPSCCTECSQPLNTFAHKPREPCSPESYTASPCGCLHQSSLNCETALELVCEGPDTSKPP